jgi:hypothetical protein
MDDKENEAVHRRKPADESADAESTSASNSSERVVRARKPSRQAIEASILKAPTTPLPPIKVSPAVLARRVPSYPAWEKPPSPYLYPQLRGREEHRPLKPLLLAATGVAIVLIAVVVVPALLGHGWGGNSAASPSRSPSASHTALASGRSPGASPSITSTPAGPTVYISYQQYKVQAGDSVARIAAKFHLHQWELLLANPKITNPALLKVGSTINIPQPGQLTPPPPTPNPSPTAS